MATKPVPPEALHAWAIYLQASEEARRRGDRRTGTDHILLALFEDPSVEVVLGVSLQQARQALDSLDHEALGALGLGSGADAPPLPMRAVPKKPKLRDLMLQKDRFRMTPAAKKVLEEASRPNRRRLQVTAQQVLAQVLTLQPPDPAAVLLGALGVNTSEVRHRLDLPGHAGRETSGDGAVPFNGQARG
jgi:Clp amino terminal domain, pathogenicity island component